MQINLPRKYIVPLAALGAALLIGVGAIGALLIDSGGGKSSSTAKANTTGKGYLGLTVAFTPNQGLKVATVEQNGPAALAGIQVGDVIRSVDGQVVRTPEQLRTAVESKAPGTQVTLTYERADQEARAQVKLGDAPLNAQIESSPVAPAPGQGQNRPGNNPAAAGAQIGIQIQQITPALKQQFSLTRDSGVVITQVLPNSGAAAAGVKPGDVLLAVNDRAVSNAEEATRVAQAAAQAGQQVSLRVLRGSTEQTLQVRVQAAGIPGLDNLPQQLRELIQNGGFSQDQLRQFERLTQGLPSNGLRFGAIKEISPTRLVVTAADTGQDSTFAITDKTEARRGADRVQPADLQPGTNVLVIAPDGQTAAAILALGALR